MKFILILFFINVQLKKIQKKTDGTIVVPEKTIKKTNQGKVTKKKRSKCKQIILFHQKNRGGRRPIHWLSEPSLNLPNNVHFGEMAAKIHFGLHFNKKHLNFFKKFITCLYQVLQVTYHNQTININFFSAISSIKSESSSGGFSGEFINSNINNNNIAQTVIKSEVTETFESILDNYTDVHQMLTDTVASSPDEQQNIDFNNNSINNEDNTITVNTNNTSLLSCGNSDATTSNNSSMNNSPNNTNNIQHSPNKFSEIRSLMNPFARLPNDLLLQTTTPNSTLTDYSSTFPIVTTAINNNNINNNNINNNNNNINPVQFQMMPHLTNSFA